MRCGHPGRQSPRRPHGSHRRRRRLTSRLGSRCRPTSRPSPSCPLTSRLASTSPRHHPADLWQLPSRLLLREPPPPLPRRRKGRQPQRHRLAHTTHRRRPPLHPSLSRPPPPSRRLLWRSRSRRQPQLRRVPPHGLAFRRRPWRARLARSRRRRPSFRRASPPPPLGPGPTASPLRRAEEGASRQTASLPAGSSPRAAAQPTSRRGLQS
mmetsp:Transcript_19838/g.63234  ORF Transcript_19838/g.63234 Transcript_19838/m.63234 type:complete len:209 (+) Transcript_19838:177-803(+)